MISQIITGIVTGLLYSLIGKAKNASAPTAVPGVADGGKFHWGKALENAVYGAAAGAISPSMGLPADTAAGHAGTAGLMIGGKNIIDAGLSILKARLGK